MDRPTCPRRDPGHLRGRPAAVLRVVRSADAMGGRTQITTVRDAAMRLGTGALLSMALASSVHHRMSGALPAYGLSAGELWKQSVSASLSTDVLRMKAQATVPPEASTAALLHDFGKVVLSTHAQVLPMLEQAASSGGMDLLSAERAVFGIDPAGYPAALEAARARYVLMADKFGVD